MIKRIGGDGKSIGEKETVAKNERMCACDDGRIIPGTVAWNGRGLNMVRHSIHASRDRQLADRSNNKISQKRGNNRWPRWSRGGLRWAGEGYGCMMELSGVLPTGTRGSIEKGIMDAEHMESSVQIRAMRGNRCQIGSNPIEPGSRRAEIGNSGPGRDDVVFTGLASRNPTRSPS
jgi:hypothetical protein